MALLDNIANGIGAWGSYLLLDAAASANCLEVRRDSDNTTDNFGFSGSRYDVSGAETFVGAGDGFVKTLYDQVSTNDAAQSTNANQPSLLESGESLLVPKVRSGNNSHLIVPHAAAISGLAAFTIAFLVRPDHLVATAQGNFLVSKHAGGTTMEWFVAILDDAASTIRFALRNTSDTRVDLDAVPDWGAGPYDYHTIVATYDGATMKVYLDGDFVDSASQSGDVKSASGADLYIGRFEGNTDWNSDAGVDAVAMWDRALTATEAAEYDTTIRSLVNLPSRRFSFTFNGRADSGTGTSQGVAYDGTSKYWGSAHVSGTGETGTNNATIIEWSRSGNTYTVQNSRDMSPDFPSGEITQLNSLHHYNGSLWAGLNNWPGGGPPASPKSWIMEINPTTLAEINTVRISDHITEGGAWQDVGSGDEFWVVFHDELKIERYDNAFTLVAAYTLTVDFDHSQSYGYYQGMQWHGDFVFLPVHGNVGIPQRVDVFEWTGSGFDLVERISPPTAFCTQGLHWETEGDGGVMLFAERQDLSGDLFFVRADFADAGEAPAGNVNLLRGKVHGGLLLGGKIG